jgi:hypothetical protein
MTDGIRGKNLVVGSCVKTWFMSAGTHVVALKPYKGPLEYLFPQGARIVTFRSNNRSGLTPMTVGNDDVLELCDEA